MTDYLKRGMDALPHTPVYKMHRYFARRPWNVMRSLVEQYSKANDVVVDCFSGGGVTLFESLSTNRKAIVADINPLAWFITDCQTTDVNLEEYEQQMIGIRKEFSMYTDEYFSTECRLTGDTVAVRWFERAYRVDCPSCSETTILSNENKTEKNGFYECERCSIKFSSSAINRKGSELLTVTYKCPVSKKRVTHPATDLDIQKSRLIEENFESLITKGDLWYPRNAIPSDWDRQHEDSLHKKGFTHFSDLFTKRLLFHNAILYKLMTNNDMQSIDSNLHKMLIFTFSAILRYTNNMLYSTPKWMDGRPVAWDKHAYWTPNQFVEVNPMEYFDKRYKAIVSGIKYSKKTLGITNKVSSYEELISGGTHMVVLGSSHNLEVPNDSVAAVITDPPYGSNVQYGELSHFWLVWLQHQINFDLFELSDEVLVNRRQKVLANPKEHADYENGLKRVYDEMYRILKPGGIMAFTFNSKNFKTWYSLIRSVINAGFLLEPEGLVYQKPIENYKNTAHSRFEGTAQGDFIYSFKKPNKIIEKSLEGPVDIPEIDALIETSIKNSLENGIQSTESLQIQLMKDIIPALVKIAQEGISVDKFKELVKGKSLEFYLKKLCEYNFESKKWIVRDV